MVREFSTEISASVLKNAAEKSGNDFTEDVLEIYNDFKEFSKTSSPENVSDRHRRENDLLQTLLKYYFNMGIRLIIAIDEVDRLSGINDGQFFDFLFTLSPKSIKSRKMNISIITISRSRCSTIVHDVRQGSNFEDAFPPLILNGFTNDDIDEYFKTYKNLPCGELPEEVRTKILYLCGRSPGLLMKMREEIERSGERDIDVGKLALSKSGSFIYTAYDRMITLLENNFADRRRQSKPLKDIFIETFIGPVYDDNFEAELMPELLKYGFVTEGTEEDNIFLMSNGRSPGARPIIYEPVAPAFVEYIKQKIIPEDLGNLSHLLEKTETRIREIIAKKMSEKYGENWEANLKYTDVYNVKEKFYADLAAQVMMNGYTGEFSKLNVLSFDNYFEIMDNDWELFSGYFEGSFGSREELREKMNLLNNSRNNRAHGNLHILDPASRKKVRRTCEAIIYCLENA